MKRIHVILGGLWGPDGPVSSFGMSTLANQLAPYGEIYTHTWDRWTDCYDTIRANKDDKQIVIGYSGGGSRATWIANRVPTVRIDLMIALDPSPSWQIKDIGNNVKNAICYYNSHPLFFGLGGGKLTGKAKIQTITVSMQHLLIQFDANIRKEIVDYAKAV